MTCTQFQRKNYSDIILNQAMNDDMGSWWWWTNAIGKNRILLFRKKHNYRICHDDDNRIIDFHILFFCFKQKN